MDKNFGIIEYVGRIMVSVMPINNLVAMDTIHENIPPKTYKILRGDEFKEEDKVSVVYPDVVLFSKFFELIGKPVS